VFGFEPDRFDHQVKLIGAVDFARHTVGLARHEAVGFAEVTQPIDILSVAVERQEHVTRPVLLPRKQCAIGAHQNKNAGREYLRTWKIAGGSFSFFRM
jgi:hypothetical protein